MPTAAPRLAPRRRPPTLPALATLAALVGCGQTPAETPTETTTDAAGPASPGLFADVTEAVGIAFAIDRSVAGDYFMPDSMGTGGALLDYDGDGDLDLYVVNGVRTADGRLDTPAGGNRLYRQESDGRFTDVSAAAGVDHRGYGMGVAVADVEGDGDPDLYVTGYGADVLYRNDGDGTFTDVSHAAGIANPAWSASAAFFDADGDGDLDLYVTNYLDYDPAVRSTDAAGRPEYGAPHLFAGVPDVLYRNDGDGTFTDVSVVSGIGAIPGKGLGVLCTDLDDDGRPDVYVANDGEPNMAWINGGDGTFTDRALEMGLALSGTGQREAGMGVAHGDTDGDGRADLLVTHLVQESNTLYRQVSAGQYNDDTVASGLSAPTIDVTGFGTALLDVDLDGDLDLLTANGRVLRRVAHAGAHLNAHWAPYAEPNQLFLNDGTGRFAEVTPDRCGALCRDVEVSRGLTVGDLDDDGDLDAVVVNGNGTVRVYRNDAPRAGHWLSVRLVDRGPNRDGLGATIEVRAGATATHRAVQRAASYLSSHDVRTHFGLGAAADVDEITVRWPDGTAEVFPGGAADRAVVLRRGSGRPAGATG